LLNLSVTELAAKFACSRRHLNRLFHQYFGFSVAALRMEMRLLKAVSLLRDPNIKIINVASQCGFNHLGLFNTCFKRRFGNSPGEWRKGGARIVEPSAKGEKCPLGSNGLCPMSARLPFRAVVAAKALEPAASRGVASVHGSAERAGYDEWVPPQSASGGAAPQQSRLPERP